MFIRRISFGSWRDIRAVLLNSVEYVKDRERYASLLSLNLMTVNCINIGRYADRAGIPTNVFRRNFRQVSVTCCDH